VRRLYGAIRTPHVTERSSPGCPDDDRQGMVKRPAGARLTPFLENRSSGVSGRSSREPLSFTQTSPRNRFGMLGVVRACWLPGRGRLASNPAASSYTVDFQSDFFRGRAVNPGVIADGLKYRGRAHPRYGNVVVIGGGVRLHPQDDIRSSVARHDASVVTRSSHNDIFISRYIVAAAVTCSSTRSRSPVRRYSVARPRWQWAMRGRRASSPASVSASR
jgi:hypothetical protein